MASGRAFYLNSFVMISRAIGILLLYGCASTQLQQSSIGRASAIEINDIAVRRHVVELADDRYEGRGAGYRGERAAAEYVAQQFAEAGLLPPFGQQGGLSAYLQEFPMHAIGSSVPWQVLKSQNVVGVLPGSELADEVIVIGAHYDGQGMSDQSSLGRSTPENPLGERSSDTIWNSAVDNAVSIAAIIEIARVIKANGRMPKRTIVFVAFGAEESSLDGSSYYVSHPFGGNSATQAMINLEKIIGDPDADFLYVSYATAKVFPETTASVVADTGLSLTAFYPGVIANTDHYPFVLSKIPAITIGTGSVNNVHLPSDHATGLDYNLLARRAGFIGKYLLALAASDGDFTFSADLSARLGAMGGPATAAEMSMLGLEGTGFKVASVVPESHADNAGVLPGDLIVAVNDQRIAEQEYYQGLEDVIGEDQVCEINRLLVYRNNRSVELVIAEACPGRPEAVIP